MSRADTNIVRQGISVSAKSVIQRISSKFDTIKLMIKDVTDLAVYQESMKLIPELYKLTNKLTRSENSLESQIKRAAQSIPANIAEGFAKKSSSKEFKRYLMIALGSSDEIITHLRTLSIINPKLIDDSNILLGKYKILSKRLNVLHHKW